MLHDVRIVVLASLSVDLCRLGQGTQRQSSKLSTQGEGFLLLQSKSGDAQVPVRCYYMSNIGNNCFEKLAALRREIELPRKNDAALLRCLGKSWKCRIK